MIVKCRLLLYRLSPTIVVFDISSMSLPNENYPAAGKEQLVPSGRFQSWTDAANHIQRLGAGPEVVQEAASEFNKAGFAVLTILFLEQSSCIWLSVPMW